MLEMSSGSIVCFSVGTYMPLEPQGGGVGVCHGGGQGVAPAERSSSSGVCESSEAHVSSGLGVCAQLLLS